MSFLLVVARFQEKHVTMSPSADTASQGGALKVNRKWGAVPAIAAMFVALPAVSQEFPSKPIRIISPFAPGGATDTLDATLAPPLSRALGQNVIVENRPGASTAIGTEAAARAPADGHTMLVIPPSYTVNPFVRKLSYDPLKDFTDVTRLASTAMMIASHPSVPAKDLKELVSLAPIAESGFPGFDAGKWFGVVVRSGTPSSIVDRLNAEIVRVLELPSVREPLVSHGLSPAPMTSEQFTALVHSEMERNGRIVNLLNLKID
jgi:tripartite-type tricarboxylate transporter receptor subunit TctC